MRMNVLWFGELRGNEFMKSIRVHLWAYLFFVAMTLILLAPMLGQFNTHLIGAYESDAYEYSRHVWWYTYAFQHGLNPYWQSLLAYPDGLPANWMLTNPLQGFPSWLFALLFPLPTAFNLVITLWLSLNGWAMFYFVRRLLNGTHDPTLNSPHATLAALTAGTMFVWYPSIQGHLFGAHVGIIYLVCVPLLLDRIYCLRQGMDWRNIGWGVFFFWLSLQAMTTHLVFTLFPIFLAFGLMLLYRRQWAWMWRSAWVIGLGLALTFVWIIPLLREQLTFETAVNPGGVVRYSADLLAIVTPSFFHPVWGQLEYTHRVLGINIVEGVGYLGILPMVLAIVGLPRRRDQWWLGLALLAWVFSLGPVLKIFDQPLLFNIDQYRSAVVLPFALVANLPIMEEMRSPGRFGIVVGFAMSVMVGYGLARLYRARFLQKRWARYLFTVGLLALIYADYHLFWVNGLPAIATVSGDVPSDIADLRYDETIRAILNLPINHNLVAKEAMFIQTAHHKPIIGGHVTRETPVSQAKLNLLQSTLDLNLLDEAGVDVVILHKDDAPDWLGFITTQLGQPRYEDERFAVFDVPAPHSTTAPLITMPTITTEQATLYAHSTVSQWVTLSATVSGESVPLMLTREGVPLEINTHTNSFEWVIPLEVGYQTYHLQRATPCDGVRVSVPCPVYSIQSVQAEPIPSVQVFTTTVNLADTVLLQSGAVVPTEEGLQVHLWWKATAPITNDHIRFVHVLDENGRQVDGLDAPLGNLQDGQQVVENLVFNNLAQPQSATVYVGWYNYPSLERLPILTAVEGQPSNWIQLAIIDER